MPSHRRGTALAKTAFSLLFIFTLTACSATPQKEPVDRVDDTVESRDPFENVNRKIFKFNTTLDEHVLKPVAEGYVKVTPRVVRTGVGNFFNNLRDVTSSLNSALQWKWGQAGHDGGRFLLNTTIGLVGLVDVASKAGLPRADGEDFGQTLATWGVGSGPYLMLPFFGPATVRDGTGMIVDGYTDPAFYADPRSFQYSLHALRIVDTRVQLMQAESLLTGDIYVLVRDAYLQRREYLINDGVVHDDFGTDDFGDDYYYYDYDAENTPTESPDGSFD